MRCRHSWEGQFMPQSTRKWLHAPLHPPGGPEGKHTHGNISRTSSSKLRPFDTIIQRTVGEDFNLFLVQCLALLYLVNPGRNGRQRSRPAMTSRESRFGCRMTERCEQQGLLQRLQKRIVASGSRDLFYKVSLYPCSLLVSDYALIFPISY